MTESAEKLNNHALSLFQGGQIEESIACFKRALTLEPENHLIWFNFGITLRDIGEISQSRATLQRAHDLNEDDEEILDALAIACMNDGDLDSALSLCAEGLSKNELNPRLWNTFGVLYFKKDALDLACESFEHAVTLNPYYYDALFNLRDTYDELGNTAGKERCAEQMRLIKATQSE